MVPWIPISVAVGAAAVVVVQQNQDRLNRVLMGFFRDVGRYKAYRRRYHKDNKNSLALMTILRKQEDPLLGWNTDDHHNNINDQVPTYSLQELEEFGSEDPLLLSLFGRIYDVSTGKRFYGPHARYHMFPGKDVTYALGTGCKTVECLEKSVDDLTPSELDEAKRWLSFFELHDRYAYVGKLENNPMEALMETWIEEAIAKQQETGEGAEMPQLF